MPQAPQRSEPQRTSVRVEGESTPAAAAEKPDAAPARDHDLESVRALWPAVIDVVRGGNAMLAALIEQAEPVGLDGQQLTVAFPASVSFLKKKAESASNRAAVAGALGELAGGRWRLAYELREELDLREREHGGPRTEQEWVARFMEEFDAEELPSEESAGVGEPEVGIREGA